jgi:hypothetical protein
VTRTLLIASFVLLSLPAFAQKYEAKLDAAQEVPPKQSSGTGSATIVLDGDKISYDVDYQGLTGPATMGHIHGPADVGANAGVLVPFANPTSPIKGSATLTPAQVTALKDGKMYVNIHTGQNPGGEIRGQLKPAP